MDLDRRFFVYLILVFKDEAEEYGEARRADDRQDRYYPEKDGLAAIVATPNPRAKAIRMRRNVGRLDLMSATD